MTVENTAPQSETDYDLIVIGAGSAGMAAALFGAIEGLRVLLLESSELVGGTTALSAGAMWIPNTHLSIGSGDTPAKAANYLAHATEGRSPETMRNQFLTLGPAAVHCLDTESEVKMRAFDRHPDYLSSLPDSTTHGRALECLPLDGRLLGDAFDLVRPPIPEFTVLGGMMVDRIDIGHLLNMMRSLTSFGYSVRLVLRYFVDRLRYPRGTRLVMGNALVGRLLLSLRKRQVPVWTGARVERLCSEQGRVTGVIVKHKGRILELGARLGVVLAGGGFNDHAASRKQLIPDQVRYTPRSSTASGELQQQAIGLGARLGSTEGSSAFWAPVSVRKRADGSTAVFPHFVLDRAKPGTLVVDGKGQRFLNESSDYHLFGKRMLEAGHAAGLGEMAYLVADHHALVKYGLGMLRPGGLGIAAFVRDGYLVQAPTIEALAQQIGVDPAGLKATVLRMNGFAETGIDLDFQRGSTTYEKNLGDPTCHPNPTLGALHEAPFYAIRLHTGDIGASTGLVTDTDAHVLRGDVPIPGLFAIGNDMQSVMAGSYPGPGITLGPAIVFAYAAVKAAQRKPPSSEGITE
ncbi:MAG: FAD-dependent oxidoreductase [Polaromonas sp.]